MAPNQIAFYPQTSGGSAGALQLIQKQTLAAPAATVTFSSIPQTFTHLRLMVTGLNSSGTTVEGIFMQFNGDTGANYSWNGIQNIGSVVQSINSTSSQISIQIGSSDNFGNSLVDATITNYTSTSLIKAVSAVGGINNPTFNAFTSQIFGAWSSAAAVTSLNLLLAGSTFATGSVISLYGIQ